MKNKKVILGLVFISLVLVVLLLLFSSKKLNQDQKKVQNEVLSYLEEKYNEKFTIDSVSIENNYYEALEEDEYVKINIPSSYIYTLNVKSSRLIPFKVIYVLYNEDNYNDYKDYDVRAAGLYENYIYEYKIREIRSSIKEKVLDTITDSKNLQVSLTGLTSDNDNILIDYSNDEESTKELYKNYRSMNKKTTNIDFFKTYSLVSKGTSLIIDLDIDKNIDKDNVENFKKEVKSLVQYLQSLGYLNYDLNFNIKNYVTSRATRYLEDGEEEIYLIFDYESYSNISDQDKLSLYIYK